MSGRWALAIRTVVLAALLLTAGAFAGESGADLAQQVTIRRTEYGVPHILAENERAAGFGMGYVQAEDHGLNIMRNVIRARGEMAKTFGGRADVASDFEVKQFRVYERAVGTYHKLDADWRDMVEGFAEGFNYYLTLHRDEWPDWAGPITAHDVAAHGVLGVQRFAFNRGNIVRRFLARLEGREETPAGPDEAGSNMWAFAPSRTKSGKAILMMNPHQPWSPVATYYEAHVTIPGKYNLYGTTFVGRPVLTSGFNENLGWTHTVNYPDLEEIYELDLDPNKPDHYLFDGGSVPLERDDVTIDVKAESGATTETRTFWHTPLGPVIAKTDAKVYVLRSASYEEYRYYQQWYRLGQAKNWQEFRDTLDILAIPMFNICYADREGNIYYLWNGTVPDIPLPNQVDRAVPARRTADIWTRFHTVDELPQWFNPKGGYVFNSNSPPYLTNLHEPKRREDYPDHFENNALSLRSQHSLLLIHNDKKFDIDDVVEMKHSMKALLADRVKDDLIAALKAAGPDREMQRAIRHLEQWDNTVAAESRGGVLFKFWWNEYSRARRGRELYAVPWSEADPIVTPRGLADGAAAVEAVKRAMADLVKRYGKWDMPWGEVHRVRFAGVDLPVGGDGNALGCFRIVNYREDSDGKLVANSGDSAYSVVEFGETPRAYTVVAYSQSEVEGTPHYADQAPLYSKNKMKRAAFTENEIRKQLLLSYHPGEERAVKAAQRTSR